jgi:hypothetical protein
MTILRSLRRSLPDAWARRNECRFLGGVMTFYREHVLPRLAPYRGRVVSAASGRVLEIGIGLPFYGNRVSQIIGIEHDGSHTEY